MHYLELIHGVVPLEIIQAGAACEPSAGAPASSDASASCHGVAENVWILAIVVTELKFGQVERQVLFADVMISADDSALEQAPKVFQVIGVDLTTHVFPFAVRHKFVTDNAAPFD